MPVPGIWGAPHPLGHTAQRKLQGQNPGNFPEVKSWCHAWNPSRNPQKATEMSQPVIHGRACAGLV